MKENLTVKLIEILANDNGIAKLSSLDGLILEGYNTKVSSIGRIIEIEKEQEKLSYFVDDGFNITELGQNIATGNGNQDSTAINNIDIALSNIGKNSITATVNASVNSGYSVMTYIFLLNGDVVGSSNTNIYTYTSLSSETTYDISVMAVDNKGKIKSKSVSGTTSNVTISRYLILEVYDHLGGDGAVINELSIYNGSGNLVTYSLPNVYESITNGNPSYWDSGLWSKVKLYDGQTAYSASTTAILVYNSVPNSGYWCRILIDLGSQQTLSSVKAVIGGTQDRTPKTLNIYSVNSYSGSTYANNVAQRNDTGLSLMGTKTFTSLITAPTDYTLY